MYRMMGNRILVKPLGTYHGPISLPDNIKGFVERAEVLDVGPGAIDISGYRVPVTVAKGDIVLIRTTDGFELENGLKLINENDILAIIQ